MHVLRRADDLPSPQRRGTTRDAAELALFKKVPPRNRKRYRALKANMERAGYQAREVLAVLRAMFVSQDDDAQLRAWRVFDPVGRGKLSIVEFKAALEICGDAIPAEAIEAGWSVEVRTPASHDRLSPSLPFPLPAAS